MGDCSFISDFHNIQGTTIGERKKNLQILLKNTLLAANEVQTVLDSLKPKTYLESLFYIDILIYTKKTDALLEVLKHGNEIFVKMIMKEQWFFLEAFSTLSAEEIVNDFLPTASFSVKMKLLKKLSTILPEDRVDKVFDLVSNRYGLFIATTVISGCSPQKIENILKSHVVKLWTYQLKIIYNKQPSLINTYFDQHKQQKAETVFEKSFLTYLAQRDPTFFWELVQKFDFNVDVKLGRRTTKKIIAARKDEIIKKPEKHIKYLRQETLVRNLNKQGLFKELYHNLFPTDIEILDQGNAVCNNLLKYYPKHDKYRLFAHTFSEVINESIWSNVSCLDDYFLDFIDNKEERIKWAQLKYKENHDDEYLKYYDAEKCFNVIKEKINFASSIKERNKLLGILVKSCALNKDLKLLEKVLKYFCDRHRNDDKTTRTDFLNTIEANLKLEELNDTHWKYVNEIITIQSLNQEFGSSNSNFRIKYIEYLYKNDRSNEDKSDAILEYIKSELAPYSFQLNLLCNLENAVVEKEIIIRSVEYLSKFLKNEDPKYGRTYIISDMIAQVFSYSLRHPNHEIYVSENESLIKMVRETMQAGVASYTLYQLVGKMIRKTNRKKLENELLEYYWEKALMCLPDLKVFKWFLNYDPLVFVEYFDKITKAFPCALLYKIWPIIKGYTHLNIDQMVLNYCLKQLKNDECEDRKSLILPLSFLFTTEDYIKFLEEGHFIPTSSKLIINNPKEKNIYQLQRIFIKNFKNLKEPLRFLPVLVDKFCQGDYLQVSLTSLYSSFHKCPENELKIYLDKLSKNSVMSVKKHSLFLTCLVFDQQMVFQALENIGKNEKNASFQKCAFSSSLKYFSKNPNEKFFEQVMFFMGLLNSTDTESLNVLSTISISENYKHSYIQSVWKLLRIFKSNANEDDIGKFNLLIQSVLYSIDVTCIQKLPHDFCNEIIQNNFLANYEISQTFSGILAFVTRFLIYRNERIINFDLVFKLLSDYKSKFWNISKITCQKTIHDFFTYFYSECYKEEDNLDVVIQFSNHWKGVFTPFETFEEYVLLNLLQIKKVEPELEEFSKKIVLFSEKVEAEFGQIVFSQFIKILADFFNNEKHNVINLLSYMLKFKTSVLNCILVMQLIILKGDLLYKEKLRRIYREIDSVLKDTPDPTVQLYYNLYLKSGLQCSK